MASTLLQAPFGTANYNALQTQFTRRFANRLSGAGELHVLEGNRLCTTRLTARWPSTFRSASARRSVTGYDRTHNFQAGFLAEFRSDKESVVTNWSGNRLSRADGS